LYDGRPVARSGARQRRHLPSCSGTPERSCRATAGRELGTDTQLDRGQSQLLEPHDKRMRDRGVRDVGQRRAAPYAQRLVEQLDRPFSVTCAQHARGT
jgi:hypothetical protein